MARMRPLLLLAALLDFPILCLCHPEQDSLLKIPFSDQQRSRRSVETLPVAVRGRKSYDNKEEKPIVKQHQFPLRDTHASRRKFRFKRSAERIDLNSDQKDRKKFAASFIEYTGWNPINYNDPMSNHPTLTYQPPALKRVHFGKDPPKSKPMFPILPQNPTVYVFALDTPYAPNINSIYDPRTASIYNLKQLRAEENRTQESKSEERAPLLDLMASASNYNENYIDKSLTLGEDDYYYYYDDEYDSVDETKDTKDLNIAPSTSFATILSQQKQPTAPNTRSTLPFARNSNTNAAPTEKKKKKSLHELLKGFDGINNDRLTPSESKQSTVFRETPPDDFRFRSIPNKQISGRRATPRKSTAKEEVPWFLIKTRSDEFNKDKVDKTVRNYKRNNNIGTARNRYAYNPSLQEYVSLEKATESLTANSLSELLQIFDYITTPRTPHSESERPKSFFKQFRYTKTGDADKLTTKKPKSSKLKNIPRNDFRKKFVSGSGIDEQEKIIDDSVAQTNSLDGYLFADSQTLPEYSEPAKISPTQFSPTFPLKSLPKSPVKSSPKSPVKSSPKSPVKSSPKSPVKSPPKSPVRSLLKSLAEAQAKAQAKIKSSAPKQTVGTNKNKHSSLSSIEEKMDKDAIRRGVAIPQIEIDVIAPKIKENSPKAPQRPYLIHQGHSRVSIFGAGKKEPIAITKRMDKNSSTSKMFSVESQNVDFPLKMGSNQVPKTIINPNLEATKSNIQSQISMPRITPASDSSIHESETSHAKETSVKMMTPANINTNRHLFITEDDKSEVNHPAAFLPSALEVFSKLFYGDLSNN